MKLSDINMYFYVSDKMEDGLVEVKVDAGSIGPKTMYYKID